MKMSDYHALPWDKSMLLTIKRCNVASLCFTLLFSVNVSGQVQLEGITVPEPVAPAPVEELPPAAQAVVDDLTSAVPETPKPTTELVTERYDNRKIKTEREVVQDEDQNYINHGKWKSYDRDGKVTVEGRYKYNEMDGVWTRLYYVRENELLNKAPFNQGQLPLVSQANFKDGKLHGKWVIFDASPQRRKLCEWEFTDGKRDGQSTWWFASGLKMREITYRHGTIDGPLNEWDRTGKQVTKDTYVDGSRLATRTETHSDGSKRAEGTVLHPRLVLETPDDWMECTLATYSQEGTPVKHGTWTSWFPNGQLRLQGQYHKDEPAGQFTWWHENGQKSLVAIYKDGKKHGAWTWWHPNGIKSIQGEYVNDSPASKWLWWKETGRVAQRADFNDPDQRNILAMPTVNGATASTPSASRVLPTSLK